MSESDDLYSQVTKIRDQKRKRASAKRKADGEDAEINNTINKVQEMCCNSKHRQHILEQATAGKYVLYHGNDLRILNHYSNCNWNVLQKRLLDYIRQYYGGKFDVRYADDLHGGLYVHKGTNAEITLHW